MLVAMTELVLDVWKTGPPPAKGHEQQYPSRFWINFAKAYSMYITYHKGGKVTVNEGMKVLHMFSGSLKWGDTTDIRPDSGAMIVAEYDNLPILSGIYDLVCADPPYADFFAKQWTEAKDFPKPKRILVEAARVTKVGGHIAILHIIKIRAWKEANVKWVGGHTILCGDNNTVRFLNVFRKLNKT